jgi:predicted CXXCH cytochrome family protein
VATTVRFVTKRANGRESARLVEIAGDSFTIGRGTDCELQLPDLRVALLHARVSEISPGVVAVEAEGAQTFVSGGRRTRRVELKLAAPRPIDIGPYRLGFREEDGRTVIDVTRAEAPLKAMTPEETDAVFTLKGSGLSKRGAAYALMAVVIAACLAFPLWTFGHKAPPMATATIGTRTIGIPAAAPQSPQMTRINVSAGNMWTAGPLSDAHAFLGADCKACHAAALKSVQDETCLHCHKGLQAHADAHLMGLSMPPVSVGEQGARAIAAHFGKPVGRCASCHMEHMGQDGIMNKTSALCTGCHAKLDQRLGQRADIGNVADFASVHPQFSPTVVATPRDNDPVLTRRWTVTQLDEARRLREQLIRYNPTRCDGFSIGKPNFRGLTQLVDRSDVPKAAFAGDNTGLVFPHALHMSASGCVASMAHQLGVKTDSTGALGCSSCHTTSPDGKGFVPVEMQRNCSACHSLTFDNFNGVNRSLPHGQPTLVVATMLDFYKAAATDVARGVGVQDRRLPGQAAADRTAQLRQVAFSHADSRAADRIRAIFSPGGSCYGCHQILKPTGGGLNYGVAPVVLQQHFLPRAEFDHSAHMTAGMSCEQCHAARSSQSATDVLMPTIESCRSCHAGEHTLAKVRSPCISCHTFHGANPSAAALKGREVEQQDVGPGRIAALAVSGRRQ